MGQMVMPMLLGSLISKRMSANNPYQPQQITMSGRDILPQTKAQAPTAPVMGNERKPISLKGKQALRVEKATDTTNNPINI